MDERGAARHPRAREGWQNPSRPPSISGSAARPNRLPSHCFIFLLPGDRECEPHRDSEAMENTNTESSETFAPQT